MFYIYLYPVLSMLLCCFVELDIVYGKATRDELWATVSHEWEVLRDDSRFLSALYELFPSRIPAVIAAGGEMTRY